MAKYKLSLCFLTVLFCLSVLSGIAFSQTPTAKVTQDWQTVDARFFTIQLPSGWEFIKRSSLYSIGGPLYDNFFPIIVLGRFTGDGITLGFKYHQGQVGQTDYKSPQYVVTEEIIDGCKTKVVFPEIPGSGVVSISFFRCADVGYDPRGLFVIATQNLTKSQRDLVIKIFRTIKFKK